ncbi:MAG: hypothetical protein QM708_13460 [Propioniciclava sp.]|uniref:hypothetical protein n=1 Tax=Propioniciclava sp. TaxID=2038686 RepID=UPI0039E666D6
MNTTHRTRGALRVLRMGAVALGVGALVLAGLPAVAHAADEGRIAVCVTESTGASFVPVREEALYSTKDSDGFVGPVGESGCRESVLPAGTEVHVAVIKDGTGSDWKTVTVPAGETLRMDYYTTNVSVKSAGEVTYQGLLKEDIRTFAKPSMELFSYGPPITFWVELDGGRKVSAPVSWPVTQTTGKSAVRTIAVAEVKNGAGNGLPDVSVRYNTDGGPNTFWVKDTDGKVRKTDENGLLAYGIEGNAPQVTQLVSINNTSARATYDTATQTHGSFQTANVVMNYNHLVQYRQGGTPETGQTHFWLTKSGMELFPGEYSFQFQVPDKKLGTAKATFPGLKLTLEPGQVVKTAAAVRFTDSKGNGVSQGAVSYYKGGWNKPADAATDGPGGTWVTLFDGAPTTITFALTYSGAQQQLAQQNLASKSVAYFQTAPVTLTLADHAGRPIQGGSAEFYATSWQSFGTTNDDGSVTKELLPVKHSFAMWYDGTRQQVNPNASVPSVAFQTGKLVSPDASVESYYTNAWKPFPADGVEVLPSQVTLRMKNGSQRTVTPQPGQITDVTLG